MSTPNRAAPEPSPVKNSGSFFSLSNPNSINQDPSDMSTMGVSSSVNKSKSEVTACLSLDKKNNIRSVVNQSPYNHPSHIIRSTLLSKNIVPWTTKLPQTSKSSKVQTKISKFFLQTGVPTADQRSYQSHSPPEYLPSQAMFHLKSKITKAAVAKSQPKRPSTHSSFSQSSEASVISTPLQQASQLIFQSAPSERSKSSLDKILLQDHYQYSEEESPGYDTSPSLSSSQCSCYEPESGTEMHQSGHAMNTRSKLVMNDTQNNRMQVPLPPQPESKQACDKSKPSSQASGNTEDILRQAHIHRIKNNVPCQQPSSNTLQNLTPDQRSKYTELMSTLTVQMKSYDKLQQEYEARQKYIDDRINSLPVDPSLSDHPPHSTSSSAPISTSSLSSATTILNRIVHKSPYRFHKTDPNFNVKNPPFSKLNYAGGENDPTFKSSSTDVSSSVEDDRSSLPSFILESIHTGSDKYSSSQGLAQKSPTTDSIMLNPSNFFPQNEHNPFTQCTDVRNAMSSASSSTSELHQRSIPTPIQPPSLPNEIFVPVDCHSSQKASSKVGNVTGVCSSQSQGAISDNSATKEVIQPDEPSTPCDGSTNYQCPESSASSSMCSTAVLSPVMNLVSGSIITPSTPYHENPSIKSKDAVRIIAQNCRGLYHKNDRPSDHYVPCMEAFQMYSPDVILLCETNTDWRVQDHFYETKLRNKAIWAPLPTKTVVASCPWENTRKNTYQPGGVMSVCVNNMPSRIKRLSRTHYGRYVKITFQAKQRSIAIYNVYRPNKSSLTSAGVDTVWMQQYRHFRHNNSKVDPRRKCIDDLITSIQKGHEKEEYPIVIGDFNEDLHLDNEFGIKNLMHICNMKQIFQEFHGVIPSSRSNHRSVFHAFASIPILKYVDRLGILQKTEGFHMSDHIPFFVDFKAELFDHSENPIIPPDFRKLRVHDYPSVEKYNCYVKDQFHHHNILQRILNLGEYIKVQSFDDIALSELEKIDAQVTDIRLRSEDRLLPDPSRFKHASQMDKQVQKIRIVQSIQKLRKQDKPCEHMINFATSIDIPAYEVETEISTTKYLKNLKSDLKFLHEEEDVIREDHLDFCIDKAVELHNVKKVSIIKNIKEREKQRRSWEKIHFATNPTRYSGIDRLGIPAGMENSTTKEIWDYLSNHNNKPDWVFITDPKEIEHRLWEWQFFHYSQAQETPLASSEWQTLLDPLQKTDLEMDNIMSGDIFSNSNLPQEAKSFLKHMTSKIQPPMSPAEVEITKEKYQSFYKGARERTSSSPSKLHLGHWKAAAYDDDVSSVLANIINIAVKNAYTLQRWQKVVGILLEKQEGLPYIHKFRTIHLVESDFNFVLRSIWGRSFMRHNEKMGSWNANQYGGRKGCQGQSAALNKVLTMDVIRHYAEPAALIDNDAKACYDRLIPVILSYSLIRLGLPKHLTRFMCSWLQVCKYHIKLAHGISEHSYHSTIDKMLFGTGQGTGWSPPNWAAISDIISDAMDEDTPGMRLVHPDNVTFSVRSFDAFVDDANGGITSDGMIMYTPKNVNSVPLMQNIFEQIQANVEHYSKLLFTSGGKLALHKCYCYVLEFEWKRGKKHMKNTASLYPPLQIDQSFSSTKESVSLLNPSVGRRMLGAISAPNGSTKDQEISLLQKSSTWGQKISKGYLNRYDVSMSFRQGILKALEYPLGVSLLTEKQCDGIMVPIMSPFLRKLGFNSKTPRSIVYGPLQHGGLQVPNLYTSQGIQKIRMFLGHTRKQDRTGTILAIALGVSQQEIGIHIPILESDYDTYSKYSSDSWIQRLWQFLHSVQAKIILQTPWVPSPRYKNDVNIMYRVSEMNISKEQKYKVNICRMYLRVYFLGEILDTSKTKLKDNIMNVTYRGYHNDKFPLIPRPPQSFIQVWQSVLRDIISTSNLGRHLGPIVSTLSFEWRISECFSLLFQYEKNVRTRAYKRSPSTSAHISYSATVEETVHMDKQDFYVVTLFQKNA